MYDAHISRMKYFQWYLYVHHICFKFTIFETWSYRIIDFLQIFQQIDEVDKFVIYFNSIQSITNLWNFTGISGTFDVWRFNNSS